MSYYSKKVQQCAERVQAGEEVTVQEWFEALSPFLDWLSQLEVTPQDKIWHPEGNVFIHTSLVLQEMQKIIREEGFTPHECLILNLAAVLHDIGKAVTTRFKDGRIVSPRHATWGRDYLALRLRSAGLSGEVVRGVMGLVGHHHDPKHLVLQDSPAQAYRRLARITDVRLLYWLERADLQGRWATDLQEQLEDLELFRMACEELDLWEEDPYRKWLEPLVHESEYVQQSAIYDHEQGLIHSPEEAIPRSYRWRERPSELLVVCGLSGSGKSTWIRENCLDHTVISMDDLREDMAGDRADQTLNGQVWQKAREDLKKALRQGEKVVWDACNIRKLSRERLITIGLDYHAWVKLVVFHGSAEQAIKQNSMREAAVPAGVIGAQLEGFQFPEVSEAHEVLFVDS